MSSAILASLVGVACTAISSAITFILTRKKYNEEVVSQRIDNISKSFDLSQRIYNETNKVQNEKIDKLQAENDRLKHEVWQLQQQVAKLLTSICNNSDCKSRTLSIALHDDNIKPE